MPAAFINRRFWAKACAAWIGGSVTLEQVMASPATPAHMQWPDRLDLLDEASLRGESFRTMTTVLVFFSIDCPYCRRHNRRLSTLSLQHSGKLRVIGAALDSDRDSLRRYRETQGLRFSIAPDARSLRERVTPRSVIPFTTVIAPDGTFKERIPGEMSEEDILGLARWASKGEKR
ncbi:MAG: hypothetical protein U5L74_12445 [Ideonella sp.]|nr:hypothetical protein [Ideonella sp.]